MMRLSTFTMSSPIWDVDLDQQVERMIQRRMGRYTYTDVHGRSSFPFGPIDRWPNGVCCKVKAGKLHDVERIGWTPVHVVSDRFKRVVEAAAGHQVQFLPISLVTRNGKPIKAMYWLLNPLLKAPFFRKGGPYGDEWRPDVASVPSNVRLFVPSDSPPEIQVDDALGKLLNRKRFVGTRCYRWRSRARIGRAPAIPDPVIPTVTFTKVRKSGGPSKTQQRREAAAAFAREHAMPRLAKLIEQEFVRLGTPATPAAVREIEKALGVRLPADYAEIIQTTGTFTIDGEEVLANGKGASHPVVRLTREFRKQRAFKWPDTAVCIYDDGRGGCSFLDTARMARGTCPVVRFDHELVRADGTPRFEAGAPSFPKFVERLTRTAMQ